MRLLLVTALGAMVAVVLATGDEGQAEPAAEVRDEPLPGVIQTGPTLGRLSPDELRYQPVTVPEPVWASVLAACAVILLRRGRI